MLVVLEADLPWSPALKELIILTCPPTHPKESLVDIQYKGCFIREELMRPMDKETKERLGGLRRCILVGRRLW